MQKPRFYTAIVEIATGNGSVGRGSVTLDNRPFILQRITHEILSVDNEELYQDGNYLVSWRDDLSTYCSTPAPADSMFGSVRVGHPLPLPTPINFSGNRTISFDVQNMISRLAYGPTFKIAFVLAGIEPE